MITNVREIRKIIRALKIVFGNFERIWIFYFLSKNLEYYYQASYKTVKRKRNNWYAIKIDNKFNGSNNHSKQECDTLCFNYKIHIIINFICCNLLTIHQFLWKIVRFLFLPKRKKPPIPKYAGNRVNQKDKPRLIYQNRNNQSQESSENPFVAVKLDVCMPIYIFFGLCHSILLSALLNIDSYFNYNAKYSLNSFKAYILTNYSVIPILNSDIIRTHKYEFH